MEWGQDLKRLRTYWDGAGARDVCLSYIGSVDPAYYGIRSRPLEGRTGAGARDIAISVNDLYSLSGGYAW